MTQLYNRDPKNENLKTKAMMMKVTCRCRSRCRYRCVTNLRIRKNVSCCSCYSCNSFAVHSLHRIVSSSTRLDHLSYLIPAQSKSSDSEVAYLQCVCLFSETANQNVTCWSKKKCEASWAVAINASSLSHIISSFFPDSTLPYHWFGS